MSRIGKKPIVIPADVQVVIDGASISVRGPKGEMTRRLNPNIGARMEGGEVIVFAHHAGVKSSALWGLSRSLLANMVMGVSNGFEKKLEIEGIGYRASLDDNVLVLQLGFSHPVRVPVPEGIDLRLEKNVIIIAGIDNQEVGVMAARIRALKKPEPYKGKGIRYQGEIIRRKTGKKAVASA